MHFKIRSKAHNFSLLIEEHGAYNLGAENVIFRPSRPLNDQPYFISTNGRAFVADGGNLLFLKDAALCVVIDLKDDSVFHMEPPTPWLYGRVWVEDALLKADLYQFDNRALSDHIEPIPLANIANILPEGWGEAAEGLFPTANHNFVAFYRKHL